MPLKSLILRALIGAAIFALPLSALGAEKKSAGFVDIGPAVKTVDKSSFSEKDILRVKRGSSADAWAKGNGYFLCAVLADLNFYSKDKSKKIEEDFTRILCDDDLYINWTAYRFKVQQPLMAEKVGGKIVLTSFMLEPCKNVTVSKNGKVLFKDKTIQPLTRTALCDSYDSFSASDFAIASDDALYKKLSALGAVIDWEVSFNGDTLRKTETATKSHSIRPMSPVYCREWIATICDMAYVIASEDYESLCYDGVQKKSYVKDQWQTEFLAKKEMGFLLQKTRKHFFRLGHCDGGGLGQLNGAELWMLGGMICDFCKADPHIFFHEFSHNMGWNHGDGNMCNIGAENGYGKKCWPMTGVTIYKRFFDSGKLPYNDLNLFNSKLFSYDALHAPDPAPDVIKDGVLYVSDEVQAVTAGQYEAYARFRKAVIPPSVQIICKDAFRQSSLEEVEIPGSVKKIGSAAFLGTLIKTKVVIPDGVEEIGDLAFAVTRVPKIEVPDSVLRFGETVTDKAVVWVVNSDSKAYEYAVKNNYRVEIPNETVDGAARRILSEKAAPARIDGWKPGDFTNNAARRKWDFSSCLDGGGKYAVRFTRNGGRYNLWISDALFLADGKTIAHFPEVHASAYIGYLIEVPAGAKKLELYALAHVNKGVESSGEIEVERMAR